MDVELCQWTEFRDLLLGDRQHAFQNLQSYGLVYGGADLMLDLRYVVSSFYILTSDFSNFSADPYGLHERASEYQRSLQWISGVVNVWPPVDEVVRASHKFDVISDLDFLALTITNTPRPVTRLLRSKSDINGQTVVKREGSDCGNAVRRGATLKAKDIKQLLSERLPYHWFVQTDIPELRIVGEVRVYVVGQQILHELWTMPDADGMWDLRWIDGNHTLEEMRYVVMSFHPIVLT
jgi:hypothetical protein